MLCYAYLWQREHERGQSEGLKDRPVTVVVAQEELAGELLVLVAPVTHSPPSDATGAVEIPQSVKRALGLDRDRSWILATEMNRFVWPGSDIRPAPASDDGSPLLGAIPEWLYERLREAVLSAGKMGRMKVVPRTNQAPFPYS